MSKAVGLNAKAFPGSNVSTFDVGAIDNPKRTWQAVNRLDHPRRIAIGKHTTGDVFGNDAPGTNK